MQNLKLLLLKNNESLIAEVEELDVDFGMPNCKLINPYSVGTDYIYEDDERWNSNKPADDYIGKPCQKLVALERWPWYTDQREVLFNSENILTILNPNAELLKAYIDEVTTLQPQETDEILQEY